MFSIIDKKAKNKLKMFDNVSVILAIQVIYCFCNSLTREIVIVTRMFNGDHVATKDEFHFRWLVGLHNRVGDHFFCAGSLISQQHVLTGEIRKFLEEMMNSNLMNYFFYLSGPLLPAKEPTRKTFTARISVQNWPL